MMPMRNVVMSAALVCGLFPGLASAQGFSPEEALKRMQVPDGFRVKLVAAEPAIRQPVTISFDDRGRLWVVQYLQYPTPAGLKPVQVDQYLRTVYDRIPEPPPKGPKGADRITILEDPDADGHYRKAKDFVTGLNLASGMALGHGGVYVAQPPYLLFYPDRDGDDVPDSDPEVLLTGFGMEDAHAFANSLQWGPDGWLYGAHGSTVTAKIRGIEFQQGIWRYHPRTHAFELFAEGGGNTWGLDFDRHGNVIAGTNWGGAAMLHQVQGGYYVKGFGKHGPLHNPHTYGYFEHVPYQNFKGGHVTCGGVLYRGGAFPEKFNDQYIAGNLLANALYWHLLEPKGSSFTAHHGGDFLIANDTWFRPIDCLVGPDGALYVADWYDKRANHVDPVDNWDRSNGRVYKVEAINPPSPPTLLPPDERGEKNAALSPGGRGVGGEGVPLSKLSSDQLVDLLNHRNAWYAGEARRLLAERRDPSVLPRLRRLIDDNQGQLALEALWALYVSDGFDDTVAEKLFDHANEDVRTWTVRLLGDAKKVSPAIRARLVALARTEPSPVVRSQLACSCKRLPAKEALPIVRELLRRKEDVSDPYIPLLLWWAIEDKAVSDREQVLALLDTPAAWQEPLVSRFILERIGRRYLAEGGDADLVACARLLAAAPGPQETDLLVQGMEKALEGRRLEKVPGALEKPLAKLWAKQSSNPALLRLALRLGSPAAYERALQVAADTKAPERERASLIEILGQAGKPDIVPLLLQVLGESGKSALQGAALTALQPFPDRQVGDAVLALYPRLSGDLRSRAQTLLLNRPVSALELLQAVDAGRVNPKEIPLDSVRRVLAYHNVELTHLAEKHWGKIGPATPGEKISRIRSVLHILNGAGGTPPPPDPVNGKALFVKHCAVCHTLFGEGNKIGPELTGADRKNREYLVTQIVDPSAVIRQEYVAFVVNTKDGRSLTGLIVEATPQAITLVDAKNEKTVLAREKIEEMAPSPVSLMPEKLLDPLQDQEIRDLFSYLQGDGPAAAPPPKPAK
jgi:putative membrane-bound dehydrogenase-like protein